MVDVSAARVETLVRPFYLKMMHLNAIQNGVALAPSIAAAGRHATVDDVVALLGDPWRATVMGAWLATLHDDETAVADAVVAALGRSHGSLDAPPLVVAGLAVAGEQAEPALVLYLQRDLQQQWGAAGFVAAALRHLGAHSDVEPSRTDEFHFKSMMQVSQALRHG